MADWLKYSNKGKIRNQQISPELQKAMGFLGDMGISMDVFSGGQDGKGKGNRRTGSVRHDHGGAADVFFSKDGRQLNWSNPDDLGVFKEIVGRARASGVTGFGAGPGYMNQGSMHIGFGEPGVWGAGGRGKNAPAWLTEAFNNPIKGPIGTSLASASPDASPGLPPMPPTLQGVPPGLGGTGGILASAGAGAGASPTAALPAMAGNSPTASLGMMGGTPSPSPGAFPAAPAAPSPMAAFQNGGMKAGLNAMAGSPGIGNALGALAGAFTGGGSQQSAPPPPPTGQALAGAEAADAGRMQAASSMMAQLLNQKRQRGPGTPGLSLMG
jgi:hypothetical protein